MMKMTSSLDKLSNKLFLLRCLFIMKSLSSPTSHKYVTIELYRFVSGSLSLWRGKL